MVAVAETEKTEKITINLGLVDLGQIDLLVQEGFYANRTDCIRTAIRSQLATHAEAVHRTVDGRRLLVIHGDEFDGVIRYAKFLALLGDWAYDWALTLNRWFNAARRPGSGYRQSRPGSSRRSSSAVTCPRSGWRRPGRPWTCPPS